MAGIIRVLMSTSCAAVISCAEVADLVGLLASAAREHHHRVRLVFAGIGSLLTVAVLAHVCLMMLARIVDAGAIVVVRH